MMGTLSLKTVLESWEHPYRSFLKKRTVFARGKTRQVSLRRRLLGKPLGGSRPLSIGVSSFGIMQSRQSISSTFGLLPSVDCPPRLCYCIVVELRGDERGSCAFCNGMLDSIDHLFFDCFVTAGIAFFWAVRCNLPWRNRSWAENLRWATSFLMGKDFFNCILAFPYNPLQTMKNHKVVKDRASTSRNVEDNFRNKRLQRSWGIDPIIFLGDP